jgi:hypothetical protein
MINRKRRPTLKTVVPLLNAIALEMSEVIRFVDSTSQAQSNGSEIQSVGEMTV